MHKSCWTPAKNVKFVQVKNAWTSVLKSTWSLHEAVLLLLLLLQELSIICKDADVYRANKFAKHVLFLRVFFLVVFCNTGFTSFQRRDTADLILLSLSAEIIHIVQPPNKMKTQRTRLNKLHICCCTKGQYNVWSTSVGVSASNSIFYCVFVLILAVWQFFLWLYFSHTMSVWRSSLLTPLHYRSLLLPCWFSK